MSTTAPAERSGVGGASGGAIGAGGAGGGSGGETASKLPRPMSSSSSAATNGISTTATSSTASTAATTNPSAQEPPSGVANRPPKRKVTAAVAGAEEKSGTAATASPGQTPRDQSSTTNTLAPQPHIQHPRPEHSNLNAPGVKSPSPTTRPPAPPPRSPAPPPSSRSTAHKQSPAITLSREGSAVTDDPEDSNNKLPPGMRTPRSSSSSYSLATVAESSLPTTPAIGTSRMLTEQMALLAARQPAKIPEDTTDDESLAGSAKTIRQGRAGSIASSFAPSSRHESESESGYRTGEDRTLTRSNSGKQPQLQRQPGYARRPTVTGKEISQQGMTVETETVSSIPQVGLGNVGPPGSASLRSKKSTETIRASKREKRKLRRTMPSGASNASTKSELFAIRVAEAVNQANSSDSDETFVYESNPPESAHAQRPTSRFHSRTPSATSVGGPENRGLRLPLLSTIDGTTSTGRGKGMKFVNKNPDPLEDDTRPTAGPSRERNRQHRSIHTDDDHHYRSRSTHQTLRHVASNLASNHQTLRHVSSNLAPTPEPTSPKLLARSTVPVRKSPRQWTQYEADIEGFEDDESTPLVRRNRAAARRGAVHPARNPYRRRSWARTYFACIVALLSTTLVLSGIAGFLVTTTNPLQNVHLVNVTDVLVSKQEIMLDLVVGAINPNIIPVTIGSMDINIFAKSAHIREPGDDDGDDDGDNGGHDDDHPADPIPDDPFSEISTREGIDRGTDPDDPSDKETMLLGRIFAFDSVLQFEGTPWNKRQQISTGELRLQRPGNKTEEGGTERWERVLAHPFELIVRGVLKYQLPLSGRVRTASVAGRVGIWPEGESDEVVEFTEG